MHMHKTEHIIRLPDEPQILLVDMDDVIADYNGRIEFLFRQKYPNMPYTPYEERTHPFVTDDYPPESTNCLREIADSKGFFMSLPMIEGSKQALDELREIGYDILICTKPQATNPWCLQEKYDWLGHYLGKYWQDRLLPTPDKTLVAGSYLIDDNPSIRGRITPTWEHILYTQPYNRNTEGKRRITWLYNDESENWRRLFGLE